MSSKKRPNPKPDTKGDVRGKARARLSNDSIPDPPPRPKLLSERDAEGFDLERTRPLSDQFAKADNNCTADYCGNDAADFDALKELERKRWKLRVAATPLPPSWPGLHWGIFEYAIFYHGSRFIDCCRPPGIQECSCGASYTCIRDHPTRGPIRWHRVRYIPEDCCSCLSSLTSLEGCSEDEGDEGETPDAFCVACKDCYVVVK